MVQAVIHALTLVLAPGCFLIFTSDGLNLHFYALIAHFGQWFTDSATGQVRWQVARDLPYGQVKKTYRRRKLRLVERLMRLGDFASRRAAHGSRPLRLPQHRLRRATQFHLASRLGRFAEGVALGPPPS
jgi:hypothetical protein